ncbi:MAG: DUF2382 domain-containing protein [Gemmatimonadota bacterium]
MTDDQFTNDRYARADDTRGSGAQPDLQLLSDLDDYQVADENPDVRGWTVRTTDGQRVGKVDDLVVSVTEMRVRYLDVDIGNDQHAMLPIHRAQLDDDNDDVIVDSISALQGDAAGLRRATRPRPGVGRDSNPSNSEVLATDAVVGEAATRRRSEFDTDFDSQDARRVVAHEEQLDIGKRQVQAGEVEVRKRVETEHVQESVPLTHEEVTLERRPLDRDRMEATSIDADQEIRVPVMREEAVVEKRPVVREEIVIRRRMVTDHRTVEADLRRERIDVEGVEDSARRPRPNP